MIFSVPNYYTLKVGDKVICKPLMEHVQLKGEIIEIIPEDKSAVLYKPTVYVITNIDHNGDLRKIEIAEPYIKIDTAYYRDLKIESIIKKI